MTVTAAERAVAAEIGSVLVIGAGAMGRQIAMLCALAGIDTRCHDVDPARLGLATDELLAWAQRQLDRGRLEPADRDAAFSRLAFTRALDESAADVDVVIEAVVEKLDVKRDLFARLGGLAPRRTILASNSSSFVPSTMADASGRPDRFVNLHFFNPALVMKCVEVVPGPSTAPRTTATVAALAERLGKTAVILEAEIPGFVANRILNAVRDEAISLLEKGIAGVEAIDVICRTALGYPMGPFELMDLTGIDIGYLTKTARFAQTGNPADAPSASVSRLVERGELGRKTGRGWYLYDGATRIGMNPAAGPTNTHPGGN